MLQKTQNFLIFLVLEQSPNANCSFTKKTSILMIRAAWGLKARLRPCDHIGANHLSTALDAFHAKT